MVEACSGLGMLVTFFALSTAVALIIRRSLTERLVVFLSAIPIALITNIVRITVTGLLYVWAGSDIARVVFHDLAGWLMMPLALFLLWIELKFLSSLLICAPEDTESAGPINLGLAPLQDPTKSPRPTQSNRSSTLEVASPPP